MIEVRTWWRGELQEVRCFAGGELTVGMIGAHLYVPTDGAPVAILEDDPRDGWVATEPPGWSLRGGRPGPEAPLRWARVGAARVTWAWGAWRVDARRVRLPSPVGRPRERPWLPVLASVAYLLLGGWIGIQPEAAEHEMVEIPDRCGGILVWSSGPASPHHTARPDAGRGPGRLLARRPDPPPVRGTPSPPDLGVAAQSVGLLDAEPADAGLRGDGTAPGTAGTGAGLGIDEIASAGWVSTAVDARIAVVPRAVEDPEAAAAFLGGQRLAAEVAPHPDARDAWVVRVIGALDVPLEPGAAIGIGGGPDALDDPEVQAWIDRRLRELPADMVVREVADRAPDDVQAVWWVGAAPVSWALSDVATTVVSDARPDALPDGIRWRGFTEAPLRLRGTADITAVELDVDPEHVHRWRVVGRDGDHLADVDGAGGEPRMQWVSSGTTELVVEVVAPQGPADLGTARLIRRTGTVAAEVPVEEPRGPRLR